MWTAVSARQHTAFKIFPFGADSAELMLYGTVAYTLKDDRKAVVDWAGRAELVREGADWKFAMYQVYLVSLRENYLVNLGEEWLITCFGLGYWSSAECEMRGKCRAH
jgi:hypothetical protein